MTVLNEFFKIERIIEIKSTTVGFYVFSVFQRFRNTTVKAS